VGAAAAATRARPLRACFEHSACGSSVDRACEIIGVVIGETTIRDRVSSAGSSSKRQSGGDRDRFSPRRFFAVVYLAVVRSIRRRRPLNGFRPIENGSKRAIPFRTFDAWFAVRAE